MPGYVPGADVLAARERFRIEADATRNDQEKEDIIVIRVKWTGEPDELAMKARAAITGHIVAYIKTDLDLISSYVGLPAEIHLPRSIAEEADAALKQSGITEDVFKKYLTR